MKKILLLFMAMVGTMSAQAENYSYLTFETTDGTKASVPVESLTLTFSGTMLRAGSLQFAIGNLSKMYFSTSDETATGIEDITSATLDEAAEIYDLQGHKVERAQMHKGVYIVKTKSRTHKMVVK